MDRKNTMHGMTGLVVFLITCILLVSCSEEYKVIEEK